MLLCYMDLILGKWNITHIYNIGINSIKQIIHVGQKLNLSWCVYFFCDLQMWLWFFYNGHGFELWNSLVIHKQLYVAINVSVIARKGCVSFRRRLLAGNWMWRRMIRSNSSSQQQISDTAIMLKLTRYLETRMACVFCRWVVCHMSKSWLNILVCNCQMTHL